MTTATDILKSNFRMLNGMTNANLTGVSAEGAALRPTPDSNNAHWVLGHIVYWRNQIVGMLGGEPLWPESDHEDLKGMKKGDPSGDPSRPFADLVEDLNELHDRTMAALEGDVPEEVRAGALSLSLHEAYHAGQLGLLRRTMGLKGAVGG